MSNKLKSEVALVFGVVIAALEAVNLTLLHPPTLLKTVIAVIVALAGALGIRANVSPTPTPSRRP